MMIKKTFAFISVLDNACFYTGINSRPSGEINPQSASLGLPRSTLEEIGKAKQKANESKIEASGDQFQAQESLNLNAGDTFSFFNTLSNTPTEAPRESTQIEDVEIQNIGFQTNQEHPLNHLLEDLGFPSNVKFNPGMDDQTARVLYKELSRALNVGETSSRVQSFQQMAARTNLPVFLTVGLDADKSNAYGVNRRIKEGEKLVGYEVVLSPNRINWSYSKAGARENKSTPVTTIANEFGDLAGTIYHDRGLGANIAYSAPFQKGTWIVDHITRSLIRSVINKNRDGAIRSASPQALERSMDSILQKVLDTPEGRRSLSNIVQNAIAQVNRNGSVYNRLPGYYGNQKDAKTTVDFLNAQLKSVGPNTITNKQTGLRDKRTLADYVEFKMFSLRKDGKQVYSIGIGSKNSSQIIPIN